MPTAALYHLAQQRVAQLHREAQTARGRPLLRARDHARSWSSSAYWGARRT